MFVILSFDFRCLLGPLLKDPQNFQILSLTVQLCELMPPLLQGRQMWLHICQTLMFAVGAAMRCRTRLLKLGEKGLPHSGGIV